MVRVPERVEVPPWRLPIGRALEADLKAGCTSGSEDPQPFVGKETAEEILDSLSRYLQRFTSTNT